MQTLNVVLSASVKWNPDEHSTH